MDIAIHPTGSKHYRQWSQKINEGPIQRTSCIGVHYPDFAVHLKHVWVAEERPIHVWQIHGKAVWSVLRNPYRHGMLWLFSDEKTFKQNQKSNTRNDRRLCVDASDVPSLLSTKFSVTVMILGVVNSDGYVRSSHIFPSFVSSYD